MSLEETTLGDPFLRVQYSIHLLSNSPQRAKKVSFHCSPSLNLALVSLALIVPTLCGAFLFVKDLAGMLNGAFHGFLSWYRRVQAAAQWGILTAMTSDWQVDCSYVSLHSSQICTGKHPTWNVRLYLFFCYSTAGMSLPMFTTRCCSWWANHSLTCV